MYLVSALEISVVPLDLKEVKRNESMSQLLDVLHHVTPKVQCFDRHPLVMS